MEKCHWNISLIWHLMVPHEWRQVWDSSSMDDLKIHRVDSKRRSRLYLLSFLRNLLLLKIHHPNSHVSFGMGAPRWKKQPGLMTWCFRWLRTFQFLRQHVRDPHFWPCPSCHLSCGSPPGNDYYEQPRLISRTISRPLRHRWRRPQQLLPHVFCLILMTTVLALGLNPWISLRLCTVGDYALVSLSPHADFQAFGACIFILLVLQSGTRMKFDVYDRISWLADDVIDDLTCSCCFSCSARTPIKDFQRRLLCLLWFDCEQNVMPLSTVWHHASCPRPPCDAEITD